MQKYIRRFTESQVIDIDQIREKLGNPDYISKAVETIADGLVNGQIVLEPDDIPEGYKRCRNCNEVKPLNDFYYSPMTREKRTTWCKLCFKELKKNKGRKP